MNKENNPWIDIKDQLPDHNQTVLVKIGIDYAIAEYDKYFGFRADDSGYDIYCHDDSGLQVTLESDPLFWKEI